MRTFSKLFVAVLTLIIIAMTSPFSALAAEQYVSDNATRTDPLQSVKQRGQMQVGEFTGAATYQYPVKLPPGRNGLTPSLNITFNSQDEALDNIVGYHWSLSQYSIQRLNKMGVDKLYTRNDFTVETPISSGELAELGGGFFAEKIESSFARYEFKSDNSWVITDKKGTRFTFGASDASRQFDPTDSNRTYRWMLEEVRDLNNNFIRYEYEKVDNQLYPSRIIYTGYGQEDGIFEVRFSRSTAIRADKYFSYATGFLVETKYLINGIEVYADGQIRGKYELGFTSIDPLVKNTLGSIQETGYSEDGSETKLPAETFEYTPSAFSWQETDLYSPPVYFVTYPYDDDDGTIVSYDKDFLWDFSGDGLVDYSNIPYYSNPDDKVLYVNDGKGGWILKAKKDHYVYPAKLPDTVVKPTDFNGDASLDIISSYINPYTYPPSLGSQIFFGNGLMMSNVIDVAMGQSIYDYGSSVADLNGDGLPDMIQKMLNIDDDANQTIKKGTCLNENGNKCKLTSLWEAPEHVIYIDNIGYQYPRSGYVEDCNNDGLADFTNFNKFWVNDGKGGWLTPQPGQQCSFTQPDGYFYRSMDLNGDGLTDRVWAMIEVYASYEPVKNHIYINKGNGFTSDVGDFPILFGRGNGTGQNFGGASEIRVFDVNGDRLPDIVKSIMKQVLVWKDIYYYPEKHVWLNTGSRPYFLKTIHTSEGGQIDLEYKTSAQYIKDDGTQANPKLPIIIDTVSKITTRDGIGNSSALNYFYEDGHYYFKNSYEKGFAGFRVITKTDELGYKTKAYYHQSESSVQDTANGEYADHISKKGRTYRTEVYDNQNRKMQVTINKWNYSELSANHYFPFLEKTVAKSISPDTGAVKSTAQSYVYDSYGNVAESSDYGEVQAVSEDGNFTDIGNDLIKTSLSYINNTADYLVGFTFENKVFDKDNQLIGNQRVYYDKLPLGEVLKGNVTKQEAWLDTDDSWASSEIDYNDYGMPIRQTNPRGYATVTTYDQYYLYPNTVANAKGHVSQMDFDIGTGNVIYQIDPNGLKTENIYDGLGRLKELRQTDPKDPGQMVTVKTVSYKDDEMPRSVFERIYNDDSIAVDSYKYFDGLGRAIESKQEAPDGNWIVSASVYDKRGNVEKSLQAYFSSSSDFEAIDQNKLGNLFTYDALNRVTRVTNPLGTTTNSYNGLETTVTDPNGNQKTYAYDARGNLTGVDENNEGSTYHTTYGYDTLNRLIQITDAQNNSRSFGYDSLGRRIWQTKLNSQSGWDYEYDANGNLVKRTDPKDEVITFSYDELDRALSEDYKGKAGIELSYIYDQGANAIGRLAHVNGQNYQHNMTYDLWGRSTEDQKIIRGKDFTFGYTYDQMGGVKTMTYPDDTVISYSYNNAHLLDEVTGDETTYASGFEHSPLGQIEKMTLGNGAVTTNTYDENQMYRLVDRTSLLSNSVKLQKYGYQYDAVGNLLTMTDENSGLTAKTVSYEYDDLYRLTEARYEETANENNVTENYQYDKIGNMMFKSDIGSYEYDSENPHAVIKAGDQTFTYDNNGNMTARNMDTMSYDYRNRLIKSNGKAEFEYGEGYDRITKTDLVTGEVKYYPNEYYETAGNSETKYIFAGKMKIAKVERVIDEVVTPPIIPPVEPPVVPPVTPPVTPPVNPPAEPPTDPLTPYPTYSITTNTGREITMQTGNYRSMEHLQQMRAIQEGKKLGLYEVTLSGDATATKTEPVSIFKNLQINYKKKYAEISWDKMPKNIVKFEIYRSKQPYPQKLSIDASQPIAETEPGMFKNKFKDKTINPNEQYTYRVKALDADGRVVESSVQLNARQIFISADDSKTVDFRKLFLQNFDKVRVGRNENIMFKQDNNPYKITIEPKHGFTGFTKIDARFLKCKLKKDGSEYCEKIQSETFEIYVIGREKNDYNGIKASVERLFASLIPTAYADSKEETYYFLTDHLGSIDVVMDDKGNVIERADYLPFGSDRLRIADANTTETDYRFTGKEMDDETGLMYYGARYYDPLLGRFTSVDPWGGDLADPQSLNKYSYAMNNPLKYNDPTGKESTPVQQFGRDFLRFLTTMSETAKDVVQSVTNVVVTRDVYEGTTIKDEVYYKDNLSVKVGPLELNNLEVQSTIDGTTASENKDNLQNGTSYDAKIGVDGATSRYIKDTLQIDGPYFFHRPAEDNEKPYSQGCTIPRTDDDKKEVMDILRQDLGFKNSETVKYSFEAAPQSAQSEKDKDETEN